MTAPDCVFCRIVVGAAPAKVVREWPLAIAIVPLHPVTPGHLLVLPREHVRDAADSQFNLITSTGPAATQTVWHLHWHIVPRRFDDGLTLPWTGQQTGGTQ
jgi:histidine triad (HIT) family protein